MILDPYGGPGGWAEGLAALGHQEIGVEWDPWACATRSAAGHRTIRADVTRLPLTHLAGRVRGVIMSPPCQAFSNAGDREGQALVANLVADVDAGRFNGRYPDRVRHMLEPGRWVTALGPEWLACEQVPQALPVWQAYARWLRARGYSAWAGVLNAADYGVPQTRARAFLIAAQARPVSPPAATHAQGGAATLFGTLAPWVSMAQALGWAPLAWQAANGNQVDTLAPAPTVCGHREPAWMYPAAVETENRQQNAKGRVPYLRSTDRPAPTVVANADRWELHTNRGQNEDRSRQVVTVDRPAPAVTAKAGGQWVFDRTQRLTITDALVLQGFRPDYPVQGTKTAQFQQVGNAVPPPLAAAVLGVVLGTVT